MVLNFTSMKDHMLSELEDPQEQWRNLQVTDPNHFSRENTAKRIKLTEQIKRYGLVFDKRVVDPITKTSLPFGFHRTQPLYDESLEAELVDELFTEWDFTDELDADVEALAEL